MRVDAASVATRRLHPTTLGVGRVTGTLAQIISGSNPAAYTISNRRITLTAAFTGYVFATGDVYIIEAGTGFKENAPMVLSAGASNFVTLATQDVHPLPIANNTNTVGYILPNNSFFGPDCTSAVIEKIVVVTANSVDTTVDIRALASGASLLSIPVKSTATLPLTIQLGGKRGISVGRGFTANVGTNGDTMAFDVYFRRRG